MRTNSRKSALEAGEAMGLPFADATGPLPVARESHTTIGRGRKELPPIPVKYTKWLPIARKILRPRPSRFPIRCNLCIRRHYLEKGSRGRSRGPRSIGSGANPGRRSGVENSTGGPRAPFILNGAAAPEFRSGGKIFRSRQTPVHSCRSVGARSGDHATTDGPASRAGPASLRFPCPPPTACLP